MRNDRQSTLWYAAICIAVQFCCSTQIAVAEVATDFLMDSDPNLQVPDVVQKYDPKLKTLWMQALERPEADMQRMAAETIARGHERGVSELDQAIPRLEAIIMATESHPAARFAAARALIVLESRDSSDKLFEVSQTYGSDLRQLIEPALADWDNSSAREIWIARLTSAETRLRDLMLAIRALGEVREQSVLPDLLSIISDQTSDSGVRLEAATAAGKIADTGLEQDAERLAGISQASLSINQLCAIRLLAKHSSEEAKQLLIQLASHDEAAVVSAALQRLNAIDHSLVLPLAEAALQSHNAEIRRQGAISMIELPEVDHVAPLSKLLADPHPRLRHEVCESLYRLSEQPELGEPIRSAAMQVLMEDRWQGQQEAALLLGALEHQPAADRLVELLESPRSEVSLPAAWALRKVTVPETVPAMIAQVNRSRQGGDNPVSDQQIAHLFEAIGVLKSEDAMPLLLEYVPKSHGRRLARGAAIWAIGRIKAGTRDAEIEEALVGRIIDYDPQPSETMRVKQMSAITLGRMQAIDQVEVLRNYRTPEETNSEVDVYVSEKTEARLRLFLALVWAVKELTGEELPLPKPLVAGQGDWFLEPLN